MRRLMAVGLAALAGLGPAACGGDDSDSKAASSSGGGSDYSMVLPDKITIFRLAICARCDTEDDVLDEVQITVVHEVGHHFGIEDDRLHELGW